jgi:hypothetical protein
MAQIIAELDFTGVTLPTGVKTVTIQTTDIYGVVYTLCSNTQDFTGMALNTFLNEMLTCINTGGSGFIASNQNPILQITRDIDIALFLGKQVDIFYRDGAVDVYMTTAAWYEVIAETTGCDACYPYDLISCYGNYVVDLDLQAATDYTLIFTDHHGNKYSQTVTTDADGKFTIRVANFPEGFFTPDFGAITVFINNVNNQTVTFTIGYAIYDCLTLNLNYTTEIA